MGHRLHGSSQKVLKICVDLRKSENTKILHIRFSAISATKLIKL